MKKILIFVGLLIAMLVMPMFVIRAAVAETDVAKIGDTGYATLKAAFEAAKSGETIVVLKSTATADNLNLATGVKFEIPATAAVTFNGYVLAEAGSMIDNDGTIVVGGLFRMDLVGTGYDVTAEGKVSIKSSGTVYFPNKWSMNFPDAWTPTLESADSILKYGLEANASIVIGEESYIYTGESTNDDGTSYNRAKWLGAITIGENHYLRLKDAFNASKDDDTIKLLGEVKISGKTTLGSSAEDTKKVVLDLNNHNINITGNMTNMITIEKASLDVTGNGSIDAVNGVFVLKGSDKSTDENYSILTIRKTVTITSKYGVQIDNNSGKNYGNVVNLYGRLVGTTATGSTGIFVNGLNNNTEGAINIVNIYPDATITTTATDGQGISALGYAKWNIDGALISGMNSGLAIKAGKFTIKNSTIKCDGVDLTPTTAISNGINGSGAAIQIESNKDYAGKIDITIENGVFASKNSATIYEYIAEGTTESSVKNVVIKGGKFTSGATKDVFMISKPLIMGGTQCVSGGLFDSNPTKFLIEGYRTYINADDMFAISKITVAEGDATISGTVTLPTGVTAVVQLRQGATILKTYYFEENSTDYEFTDVADGNYNVSVVGTNSSTMKTVTVAGKDVELNIELPATGSQEVVIAGANTPAVVVKGLDAVDDTANVEATIELIDSKAADIPAIEAIKEEDKTNNTFLFLDITLKADGTDITALNSGVLEFLVPFTDTGATNLKFYRYHGADVQEFTALKELPERPADKTFFYDKTAKVIHVYANQFSVYAASYTSVATNPKTIDNIGIYALISLISVIGVCSVVFAKKRFN